MPLDRKKLSMIVLIIGIVGLFTYFYYDKDKSEENNKITQNKLKNNPTNKENIDDVIVKVHPINKEDETLFFRENPFQWGLGTRQSYHYSFISSMAFNPTFSTTVQPSALQKIKLSINAILNFKVLSQSINSIHVGFQLSQPKVTQGTVSIPEMDFLYGQLFIVTFNPKGKIIDSHFPQGLDKNETTPLLEIISGLQIVFPEEKQQTIPSWSTEEKDSIGDYKSDYTINGYELSKKKTAYTYVKNQQITTNKKLTVMIHSSAFDSVLSNKKGWFKQASAKEEISIKNGDAVFIHANKEITLEKTTLDQSDILLWKLNTFQDGLDILKNSQLSQRNNTWDSIEKTKLQEQLKNKTLSSFIDDLKAIYEKKDLSNTEKIKYLNKLNSFLIAYPENIDLIIQMILNKKINTDLSRSIISYLADMNIKEAQQGLATFIQKEQSNIPLLEQAIISSGTVETPTEVLTDSLWENVATETETSGTALLALGSNSYFSDKSGNTKLSTSIKQRLLSSLGKTNDLMTSYSLRAIANSVGEEKNEKKIVFDSVKSYVNNDNAHIRQSVYKVFGKLEDNESRQLLLSALRDETSNAVKKDVIDSISERKDKATDDVIETIAITMEKEKDKRLYKKMINLLGNTIEGNKKSAQLLEQQLLEPLPKDVKKAIYEALY